MTDCFNFCFQHQLASLLHGWGGEGGARVAGETIRSGAWEPERAYGCVRGRGGRQWGSAARFTHAGRVI